MGKHFPITAATMEKVIVNQQESTELNEQQKECVELQTAQFLIKSDNPRIVHAGIRMLMNIYNRQLKTDELTEFAAFRLADRRKKLIREIEKRNNETGRYESG